jgi:hypothetical protein
MIIWRLTSLPLSICTSQLWEETLGFFEGLPLDKNVRVTRPPPDSSSGASHK